MTETVVRSIEELRCDAYNSDPTRVRRVARNMPDEDAFDRAAVQLKLIADPIRLQILYALSHESLCVCELSVLLNKSMPAVSHHLKLLLAAGLLKVRKEGKFACYYLRGEHLEGALGALLDELTQSRRGGSEDEDVHGSRSRDLLGCRARAGAAGS